MKKRYKQGVGPSHFTIMDVQRKLVETQGQPLVCGVRSISADAVRKSAPTILTPMQLYQTVGKKSQKELENSELQKLKLREDTLYVPPGAAYHAPHPLSNARSEINPNDDMKAVRKFDKKTNVIPTGDSTTYKPLEQVKQYDSVEQLHKVRNKHTRSIYCPYDMYNGKMTQSSQAIGWMVRLFLCCQLVDLGCRAGPRVAIS